MGDHDKKGMTSESLEFFATVPRRMEPLLALELEELGAVQVERGRAGVGFCGSLTTAYRVCLWSRLASRVLLPLGEGAAATAEELYSTAKSIPWENHLEADGTLAVDCNTVSSPLTHSHYAALKVKDAIVDRFRDRLGRRPSVDVVRPDIRVNAYAHGRRVRLSLDLSGDSLHRRGYRRDGGGAPLKENLAAAILLRAGWPEIAAGGGGLLDPMCGSGTLPIEAALIAGDVAPGMGREYFGFLGWRQHAEDEWTDLKAEAARRQLQGRDRMPSISGYDADPALVRAARENAKRAGVGDRIHLERRGLDQARPAKNTTGLLVANPPYGERMGDEVELVALYTTLGQLLKNRFPDWHAAVFSANPRLRVGLRPSRVHQLYNGPLDCTLSLFRLAAERRSGDAEAAGPDEVQPGAQPGVVESQKSTSGAQMLANRLRKNQRIVGKWARRQNIDCFRLYDADLPEYAVVVDLYKGDRLWAHVQEYEAPATIDPTRAAGRRAEAVATVREVLDLHEEGVVIKVRQRQRGGGQYARQGDERKFHEVAEGGLRFLVNFTDYLDTGLFLDHRPTRHLIRELAAGKSFLNLFSYTGSATAYAIDGGARATTSVDISSTYLDWAQRNLDLNGFAGVHHQLVREDVMEWIDSPVRQPGGFDLVFLDPPTFSRSKRMQTEFEVQRDHPALIISAARLLEDRGVLLFSTNFRKFKLQAERLGGLNIEDITRKTVPRDFARRPKIHQCWKITKA